MFPSAAVSGHCLLLLPASKSCTHQVASEKPQTGAKAMTNITKHPKYGTKNPDCHQRTSRPASAENALNATNEEENKCLSSAHRRNSRTNMHRAKTSATRGEQPGTYQCAAPMVMYASSTLPADGAALCIAGCSIACATLTQATQRMIP